MEAFLQLVLRVAIALFAVSSMASVGVGSELRDVLLPFRRPIMLLTTTVTNFVAVPLLGALLLRAFDVPPPFANGLFLVACAGGAAFLVALAQVARADVALAGGHLLILMPATTIYMPLVVPWAMPEAQVDAFAIARPLVLTMLLPLGLGILFRKRFLRLVRRVMPVLRKTSKYSLLALIAATVLADLPQIIALLGTPAVLVAALLVLGGVVIGFIGSVPGLSARVVLALGTGQRNIAAAMIVASNSFTTPEPLVMVVVTSLVGFVVLFPAADLFRRALERHHPARRVRFGPHREQSRFNKRRRT
ncbi:MAG: bile acid:sodium symporter family protein [Myxococcales bacterium]|jgi:predicted Na+-dependent transporter